MPTLALLYPLRPQADDRPVGSTDFGRAAVQAEALGIRLVMGSEAREGCLTGVSLQDARWVGVHDVPVDAALHRFPDGDRPDAWRRIAAELAGVPRINPDALVRTCRDKAATHERLADAGVAVPMQTTEALHDALDAWGTAFLKPRYGAFGRGVRVVRAGDPLPPSGDWVLQRAVPPLAPYAGVSVRMLVQREPDGSWVICPGAARVSHDDAVVNHARGAHVVPLSDLAGADVAATEALARETAAALSAGSDGDDVGELGIDIVLDPDGRPWVIEVNGKPRGRLAALCSQWPDRFAGPRDAALLRPLRFAASRAALHPHAGPTDAG